jgi:hypothetical protein
MGLTISKARREAKKAKTLNNRISLMMRREFSRENQIVKVLLTGEKNSGRTTFMKQMKVRKVS